MRSGPPRSRFTGNQSQRPQQRGQTFESRGPDVRIRGGAHQIFERYVALAREAAIGGDRIAAENLYQHAEHYFRLANAARDGNSQAVPRPAAPPDVEVDRPDPEPGETDRDARQPGWGNDRPGFI